jgi:hypothetical protein
MSGSRGIAERAGDVSACVGFRPSRSMHAECARDGRQIPTAPVLIDKFSNSGEDASLDSFAHTTQSGSIGLDQVAMLVYSLVYIGHAARI